MPPTYSEMPPPAFVKPYVKRGKTDAADAEAIAEAVTRPIMRFVAVKTEAQQAVLMLHKIRDLLVRQRTMLINALRGHMSEFGIVSAQDSAGVQAARGPGTPDARFVWVTAQLDPRATFCGRRPGYDIEARPSAAHVRRLCRRRGQRLMS